MSKVILIDADGVIRYQGDVNDSVLHVTNLKELGLLIYGNDSIFNNISDSDSPNKPCYYLLKEGNLVILNLSRFGDKFMIGYISPFVNDIQREKYNYILDCLNNYEVLTDFLDEDMDENLIGYMVKDRYSDGFFETKDYLHVNNKNKGI